ncbi:MAG: S-methyl-5-thioribose-1-phosphate isomerase [Pelosinus sp.]|nr:S-methyl-5-thioribose-1-phosphate isomerase [Pelosinus sp.]
MKQNSFTTMKWQHNCLCLLNQTLLPATIEYIKCSDYLRVIMAIKRLEVRGAPAIGAAAAFAVVLGAQELVRSHQFSWQKFLAVTEEIKAARPTAVNLAWAVNRMVAQAENYRAETTALLKQLEQEAMSISSEDIAVNRKISEYGATLFTKPLSILTHCNAGALATVAFGTALGVIRQGFQEGRITRVFADETRPLLQGARLTAWELMQDNIPVTLITDNMAGWVMKNKMVQAVIVGADRIALNGDVANKIGTYSVAVLAKEHGIPFYVAAPLSTFDFTIETGSQIPIEERLETEVTTFGNSEVAPKGVTVFNPAFDVTPNQLVSAIITEKGIIRAPYSREIQQLKNEG